MKKEKEKKESSSNINAHTIYKEKRKRIFLKST